ncbi:MAG TPA: SEC-C metal-binding domain-containing protein [Aggregatilineales bacterium]|nr:SEC-C metal-binding domain-containing protein [Aggregatilineales bacterium]
MSTTGWSPPKQRIYPAFERTSKRRRGYPSETHVRRGYRVVHGDKELIEKLGRNDLCPCGSGRRFQTLLYGQWELRRFPSLRLLLGNSKQTKSRLWTAIGY